MNINPKTPKYTVIIPTLDRCEYLRSSVASVLSSPRTDFELIVSDNQSTDSTKSYLSSILDPRLRVLCPPSRLPMAAHYEYALQHAEGEWITILGDDDALMPYCFDSLDTVTTTYSDIKAISSKRAYYFWPGTEDIYGNIVVDISFRFTAQRRSTLIDYLLSLTQLRSIYDLPMLYTTGFIHSSLYTAARQKSYGHFFHSIIPDMYSAAVITALQSQYIRLYYPLSIVGTSSKSFGRKNRIYGDASSHQPTQTNIGPTSLSPGISQELHSEKFPGLYLYEAYLALPFKGLFPKTDLISFLACTSLISEMFSRNPLSWPLLFHHIRTQSQTHHVSAVTCIPFAILLTLVKSIHYLLCKINRLLNLPMQRNAKISRLKSRDRPSFPSINSVINLFSSSFINHTLLPFSQRVIPATPKDHE